jgi:epoxyqueuosine reductase
MSSDPDLLVAGILSFADRDGVAALGICGTEELTTAREVIVNRKDRGLHGGMEFTFRNPSRSADPRSALPSAESAIVVAQSYTPARPVDRSSPDNFAPVDASHGGEKVAAEVAAYAAVDAYGALRETLGEIAALLKREGYKATAVADSNALIDRAIAFRAGIGWFGKNTNILVPGVGSWVVLGSVLTDAVLPATSQSPVGDGCGRCTRCITACPTGAIVAPGELDASRCLSWLLQVKGSFPREFREALGVRIYGCDDCQAFCPPNRGAPSVQAGASATGASLEIEWLLEVADSELMETVGDWYVPDRDPRYVRRNALVALGNSGIPSDRSRALLERWLDCGDEMLVEHAAWAARRLGEDDLLEGPRRSTLSGVMNEMSQAPPEPLRPRQAVTGNTAGVSVGLRHGRD